MVYKTVFKAVYMTMDARAKRITPPRATWVLFRSGDALLLSGHRCGYSGLVRDFSTRLSRQLLDHRPKQPFPFEIKAERGVQ